MFPADGLPTCPAKPGHDEASVTFGSHAAYGGVDADRPIRGIHRSRRSASLTSAAVVARAGERQVRVVVVDDHDSLRQLLLLNLEMAGGFAVVGEGGDGDDAVRLVAETAPDVLVLDIGLPGRDGYEVLAQVRQTAPETRVVVFTGWSGTSDRERVLAAGAHRFVVKSDLAAVVAAARDEGLLAAGRRTGA